jgi:uncharacterized membrane protein
MPLGWSAFGQLPYLSVRYGHGKIIIMAIASVVLFVNILVFIGLYSWFKQQ